MREQPATKSSYHLAIVDDHPIVVQGLKVVLETQSDLSVRWEAASAQEALERAAALPVDLVLVDLVLDDGNSLDLVRALREQPGKPRVLVMSGHSERLYAERALRAGAMGYLMKRETTRRLVEAVRCVLSGRVFLSEDMVSTMLLSVAKRAEPEGGSPLSRLSDRELEVLRLIGEGLKPSRIAEKLFLSVRTIESHRDHIRRKLNIESSSELVRFAVESLRLGAMPGESPEA